MALSLYTLTANVTVPAGTASTVTAGEPTTGRYAQASRLIAVQRCQEVQVVTWPLSSPLTCFDS